MLYEVITQDVVVEFDIGKDGGTRMEADLRSCLLALPAHGERCNRVTEGIVLLVDLPITANQEMQAVGEGIHDRDANTVQTTRDLIGVVIELTAGVKYGHDDLGG